MNNIPIRILINLPILTDRSYLWVFVMNLGHFQHPRQRALQKCPKYFRLSKRSWSRFFTLVLLPKGWKLQPPEDLPQRFLWLITSYWTWIESRALIHHSISSGNSFDKHGDCDGVWWWLMVLEGVWWWLMVPGGAWWWLVVCGGLWWWLMVLDGV